MTPWGPQPIDGHDAIFLALALGVYLDPAAGSWRCGLAPLVSWTARAWHLGEFHPPAAALGAWLLTPSGAPVSLLLASPDYTTPVEALTAGAAWLLLRVLLDTLAEQLEERRLPARLRGAPARLILCAVLHAVTRPLAHL